MTIGDLVAQVRTVGLQLTEVDDGSVEGSLYAWVTPRDQVLYIGKSESETRVERERKFAESDPAAEIVSAFVALVRRNDARCQRLKLGEFDPEPAIRMIEADQWGGHAFDVLLNWLHRAATDDSLATIAIAEKLLIRTLVRCGVPIANSRDASQWESPIGNPIDTLAVLASAPVVGRPLPES